MPCTTILIGKSATYDGSTIIARDDDTGHGKFDPKRFVAVNPEDQPRQYRSTLSHVRIELPDDPCRYSIAPNALPNRGILAEAGVSERNVAMTATETLAVNERVLGADPLVMLRPAQDGSDQQLVGYEPERSGGIGEEDFITLVLPYVHSAREAVTRLGALLAQYGTYEVNGVGISDVDDVWYVETIGGHHWIAKRVPDDCYAAIPNQLGIDEFDLDDALGARENHMCSADMREFIAHNHLDRSMDEGPEHVRRLNPRKLFGTATPKDHIYNTPRAWYMQRTLNPSEDWDSPAAPLTPISEDIPWCRVPENKVTIEDIDFIMSSHYEDTPYDVYGVQGTEESRHRYRPIGINRNGHLAILQLRPYEPEVNRAVMWLAFGSNPFTSVAPFYTSVRTTPEYLACTTGEVTTDALYWTNRIIAAIADPHFASNSADLEHFREDILSYGHKLVADTDAALKHAGSDDASGVRNDRDTLAALEQANEAMADYLRKRTKALLATVLFTSSNLMNNSFSLSDR
ncbi:C69 family dipeptidase [Bifidobacterium sp.]|jgi:dipeptidase|uniref:C69 family dipeptidase n=1 Tax=Bifidobacterium sp. TaxID=41200 RepID=UPI0025C2155C|nr:C69 family dipeptidase [Bifidobacterium sp.]MCH4209365.1 C69 family dipeptidase [Bifidobacterium sp.]MCI1225159.1 C69 family dipeptidase [Bifidobacterium sp.]